MKHLTFLGIASLCLAASGLPGQIKGTYTSFGSGCRGSASSGPGCLSANLNQSFAGNRGVLAHFGIQSNTGSTLRIICGFELFCKTVSGNTQTVRVWLQELGTNGLPGKILVSNTMLVGGTAGLYRTTFTTPVIIKANTSFVMVFDNTANLNLPIMTAGTRQIHFWNGPTAWRGPSSSFPWNYNVLCCGAGGAVPKLDNTGVPSINNSFKVNLSLARASSAAILLTGASRVNVSLQAAGAPGCFLLTVPLLIGSLPTSPSGTATVMMPVPNDRVLINVKFTQQWAVLDPQINALKLVFSNGGEGKIGG